MFARNDDILHMVKAERESSLALTVIHAGSDTCLGFLKLEIVLDITLDQLLVQ